MVAPAEGPAQASPLRHPRFSPSVIPASPLCHPGLDPGSRALHVFSVVGAASNAGPASSSPRHHMPPSHPLPLERAGVRGVVIPSTARNLAVAFGSCPRAIPWRHIQGACGRGCAPVPNSVCGGEDCLSEASSAALTFGLGQRHLEGHARAPMVFGSFCRNKRTASCGGATPQEDPPRRAGPRPRKYFPSFVRRGEGR